MSKLANAPIDGIAIIGMSGRFPGASDVSEFWRNLADGVEGICRLSDDQLRSAGVSAADLESPTYVKARGILDGADLFDAEFFGFTPREAELTDPQHRVLLECAWNALEDAGYDPAAYAGKIGMFAGASPNRYFFNNIAVYPDWSERFDGMKVVLGNDLSSLATRVAYKLDLRGPAVNVQTACSTSLTAVHLGCQSLLGYEADIVLAGGISIACPQEEGYHYQEGGILSPDGHCRAFDADARGTVSGSGVGVVVLKRLVEALADGDNICAVIRGSAINNDGSTKVGFTAPSVLGQADVIAAAQSLAGVDADMVTYVEAHGTGTPLGDPVEVEALTRVFSKSVGRREPCALGSVKANIGHLDAAAGVAALIKVVLALQHKKVPPSLHFQKANPQIDLERSPFRVSSQLQEWNPSAGLRIAGVSSFGIGGTNAHAVVQEAPVSEMNASREDYELLVLSGKTDASVRMAAGRLARHLESAPNVNLEDVAYTLQVGRRAFAHRQTLVCKNIQEAGPQLNKIVDGVHSNVPVKSEPAVVFLFPGQGTQYVNMSAKLYASEPVFAQCIDECAAIAAREVHFDFRRYLYPAVPGDSPNGLGLDETVVTQIAVFSVDYALAQLWMHLGIQPKAMLGHSLGEYVAACVAGVLSLEQAVSVVCTRAALMQSLPRGAMTSVLLSEKELLPLIPLGLDLAAVNGPRRCVVSGPVDVVEEFEAELSRENVVFRRLRTSHAFHSAMMEPVMEPLARKLASRELKAPQIPYISNLTGVPITASEAMDPEYWSRHVRSTVRFGDGFTNLTEDSSTIFVEVGAGVTLTGLLRDAAGNAAEIHLVSSLGSNADVSCEREHWLKAVGTLWVRGRKIDWPKMHSKQARRRVSLPGYPFQRKRYFLEKPDARKDLPSSANKLKLESDLSEWFYVPVWKQSVITRAGGQGERIGSFIVFSGRNTLGSRLADRLERWGHSVVRVALPEQGSHGISAVESMREPDFDRLLRDAHSTSGVPCVIVDFTGNRARQDVSVSEGSELDNLLLLVRALTSRQGSEVIHIGVLTNGLYRVTGSEDLKPENAFLLGPALVLAQEVPGVSCELIDVSLPIAHSVEESRLFHCLEAEFLECRRDSFVAYRGDQRWTCIFETLTLPAQTTTRRLRDEGVYLISGGLGGLGMEIAEFLARTAKARLVLINRTPFPPREQWDHYLECHNALDPTCGRIVRIRAMEAMGAKVLVVAADVSDETSLHKVVSEVVAHFGAIHGIVHAAGSSGGRILALQSSKNIEAIIKTKAAGAVLLEQLTREQQLDFMILFSSHVSILGGVGRADYAAANAFLEAFAHNCHAVNPGVVTAINWDTWAETGMAADEALRLNVGPPQDAMTSANGVEAFRRILDCDLPQVIVSVSGFSDKVRQSLSQSASRALEKAEEAHATSQRVGHERPELTNAYAAPATREERVITDLWEGLLGIRGIGAEDNFFELGGDSVIGIQVVAQLRKAGVSVTPKQVFEHPTPRTLAAVLNTRTIHAEQRLVLGDVPLTPVQRWLFEGAPRRPNLFNQDVLVTLTRPVNESLLQQAFDQVVKQHDALRLRLKANQSGWTQWIADFHPIPISSFDFCGMSPEQKPTALEKVANEVQSSLSVIDGPIIRMALFNFGDAQPARLLIVVHHIGIDGISWPTLLEDLQAAYLQLAEDKPPGLPLKTTSFQYWARKLEEYARLKSVERESRYWLSEDRKTVEPLPVDFNRGDNYEKTRRGVPVSFSKKQTEELTQAALKLGAQVHEILLASVSKALQEWTGVSRMLADVEGLGREPLFEEVDLSRTVGWFTAIYPLFLSWPAVGDLREVLDSVRTHVRSIPQGGIGYGLLRYMGTNPRIASDLRDMPQPEISFLYAGQSRQEFPKDSLFGFAPEASGISRDPEERHRYLVDFYARITEGRLVVNWGYSEAIHSQRTMEKVADSFANATSEFIRLGSLSELPLTTSRANEFGWSDLDLEQIYKAIEESKTAF